MMELHIRNYRRIASVDIEIGNGVTLVAGRNDQGKTSIAEAARAVLTGEPIVAAGDAEAKRTQTKSHALIHHGAENAAASLVTEDGSAAIGWPDCKYKTKGAAIPRSSRIAAGVLDVSLPNMKPIDRLGVLREVLGGEPSREDLDKFFKDDTSVSAGLLDKIWKKIQSDDWDGTYRYARDKGVELKGAYQQATGEKWGVRKSAGWAPDGWDVAWEGQSAETFGAAVEASKAALEELAGDAAISRDRIEALNKEGEAIEELRAAHDELVAERDAKAAELQAEMDKRASLVLPNYIATGQCPHCQEEVWIVNREWDGGKMKNTPGLQAPAEGMKKKEIDAVRMKVAKLDGSTNLLKDQLQKIEQQVSEAREALGRAEQAVNQLAQLGDTAGKQDETKLAEARERVVLAERQLAMVKTKIQAGQIHAQISVNQKVCAALDESGVRATVLGAQIAIFNKAVLPLAKIAGLGEVVMDDKGALTYAGTAYRDLSGSAQLRARAVLQTAIAVHDKSAVIVIDIDEATDNKHVGELCQMLSDPRLPPSLVCVHVDRESNAPDLSAMSAHGVNGRTYIVHDGRVELVGAQGQEKAA